LMLDTFNRYFYFQMKMIEKGAWPQHCLWF